MYFLFGGYELTPEQIRAWFNERGVELKPDFYTAQGNRYFREGNFKARIRSCVHKGQHCFLVLTHKATIADSEALGSTFIPFKEDDVAHIIKKEMEI